MTFSDLKDFLINRMRMSHIYQPVMLMTLLKNGGVASVESLAKDLLINDQSQMEHYDNVTKNMVGRILTKNNVVKRDGNSFNLVDYERFNEKERNELMNGKAKPQAFLACYPFKERTEGVHEWKGKSPGISGSLPLQRKNGRSS